MLVNTQISAQVTVYLEWTVNIKFNGKKCLNQRTDIKQVRKYIDIDIFVNCNRVVTRWQ